MAMIMTSAATSTTSIEPSPSSGEKPKCRSMKSMGAGCCVPKHHRATNRDDQTETNQYGRWGQVHSVLLMPKAGVRRPAHLLRKPIL